MSKNDKNIDAYSKALLDKKTEYNDELKKPKEVHLTPKCLWLLRLQTPKLAVWNGNSFPI